jgi:hypothetical protein
VQYVWKLNEVVDKQNGGGLKTVLKEKVWLGTYHTPINAAVHHDFYKVVLAVEGCIYTSVDVPSCSTPTGKLLLRNDGFGIPPFNFVAQVLHKHDCI